MCECYRQMGFHTFAWSSPERKDTALCPVTGTWGWSNAEKPGRTNTFRPGYRKWWSSFGGICICLLLVAALINILKDTNRGISVELKMLWVFWFYMCLVEKVSRAFIILYISCSRLNSKRSGEKEYKRSLYLQVDVLNSVLTSWQIKKL